jgi:hypothetical protein
MIGLDLSESQAARAGFLDSSAGIRHVLRIGATRRPAAASHTQAAMRPLLKSSLLIDLQQNKAGLIVDGAIVVLFLVLLALR